MNGTELGTLIRWNGGGGYGFIKRDDGGADAFLHAGEIPGEVPEVGQRLRFMVTATDRGPRASAVELLNEHGTRR